MKSHNHIAVNADFWEKFHGPLRNILKQELEAGNQIAKIYEGDYPREGSVMVFLVWPFKTPIPQTLNGIEYRDINDPHYWKAEYADESNNLYLCC